MNTPRTPRFLPISSLACLLLLAASFAAAQQLPSAITTDPPPDKQFPAGMEAPDVISHGSRLNAVLFTASGAGPHPTVLMMHGSPRPTSRPTTATMTTASPYKSPS